MRVGTHVEEKKKMQKMFAELPFDVRGKRQQKDPKDTTTYHCVFERYGDLTPAQLELIMNNQALFLQYMEYRDTYIQKLDINGKHDLATTRRIGHWRKLGGSNQGGYVA